MQEARFQAAVATLADAQQSVFVIVMRPEKSALVEAAYELKELGLGNQTLIVNQVFRATRSDDPVAKSIENLGREVLEQMPPALRMFRATRCRFGPLIWWVSMRSAPCCREMARQPRPFHRLDCQNDAS